MSKIKTLPVDRQFAENEPNDLPSIRALRPRGPRRIWKALDIKTYAPRLKGALLGRMAGCTLGAPVELWSIDKMRALAKETCDNFPPTDYWCYVIEPASKRYGRSRRESYTRAKLNGVPVDDDIAYTLLGLLILEEFGSAFTVEEVGQAWLRCLPFACTAEDVALRNLKNGCSALKAAEKDNPYCEWIGAAIRADPWGYAAPGWPERAAEMAYRDAYISHRREGIYGAMFFAATISAAFAVDDPVDALRIGLTEIPRTCTFAKAVKWALRVAPEIRNYQQARDRIEKRFEGMHPVHVVNNACLTIWGIKIGGMNFSKVIGQTVAMGMDNDCNAATAGSIVGAVVGKKRIPDRWHKRFNDTVHSYLIGKSKFSINELVRRYCRQAERIHG